MGFGGGHMQDMVNKIKQNRELKESRRSTRDKIYKKTKTENIELSFKEVSPQELEKINARNRLLAKKERLRVNILTALIGIPLLLVILYTLYRILDKNMRY